MLSLKKMGGEGLPSKTKTTAAATTTTTSDDQCLAYLGYTFIFIVFLALVILIFVIHTDQINRKPEFQVDSVSAPILNLSTSSQVIVNWTITFSITNPNLKIGFFYDNMVASVFFRDDLLFVDTVAPFYMAPSGDDHVPPVPVVASIGPSSPDAVNKIAVLGITRDMAAHVPTHLYVSVQGRIWSGRGTTSESKRTVTVSCKEVDILFPSQEVEIAGVPKECHVEVNT